MMLIIYGVVAQDSASTAEKDKRDPHQSFKCHPQITIFKNVTLIISSIMSVAVSWLNYEIIMSRIFDIMKQR
jgi:hypothetical protein